MFREPSRPRSNLSKSVLTPEEQITLLRGVARRYANYPSVQYVLAGTLYAGMRRSELSHVVPKWLGSGFVSIPAKRRCTRKCSYCYKLFRHPAYPDDIDFTWHVKTPNSVRVIPVSDIASLFQEYVHDHYEYDAFSALKRFTKTRLKPVISHSQIYAICTQRFTKLVGRYVHPHTLRATCATNLAISGLDKYSIDKIMGWSLYQDMALHYINFANRKVEMHDMMIRRDGLVKYTWIARGPD